MDTAVLAEILALKNASLEELQKKYSELYSDKQPPNISKIELWKRIAYKLQEREYGAISVQAKEAQDNLINEFDPINQSSSHSSNGLKSRDKRLPIPGSIITKTYKGNLIEVKVLEKGFEYNDKIYKTLTSVVKAISGIHWSGYLFFNL